MMINIYYPALIAGQGLDHMFYGLMKAMTNIISNLRVRRLSLQRLIF